MTKIMFFFQQTLFFVFDTGKESLHICNVFRNEEQKDTAHGIQTS